MTTHIKVGPGAPGDVTHVHALVRHGVRTAKAPSRSSPTAPTSRTGEPEPRQAHGGVGHHAAGRQRKPPAVHLLIRTRHCGTAIMRSTSMSPTHKMSGRNLSRPRQSAMRRAAALRARSRQALWVTGFQRFERIETQPHQAGGELFLERSSSPAWPRAYGPAAGDIATATSASV